MHNIKVSKILEALNRDGWELVAQNGSHRQYKNLFIFNGLGARGVYNGSYFSKVLFDYLEKGGELDPEIDVKRFYNDN